MSTSTFTAASRRQRDYSPLSVPAMAIGIALAALVTGVIVGSWAWGMVGGMGTGGRHMPYGYGYTSSVVGMMFVVGPFIMGGIFGGLTAWFYNLLLPSVVELGPRPHERAH